MAATHQQQSQRGGVVMVAPAGGDREVIHCKASLLILGICEVLLGLLSVITTLVLVVYTYGSNAEYVRVHGYNNYNNYNSYEPQLKNLSELAGNKTMQTARSNQDLVTNDTQDEASRNLSDGRLAVVQPYEEPSPYQRYTEYGRRYYVVPLGEGIWCGIWVLIAGCLCIVYGNRKVTATLVHSILVVSIIGAVLSPFAVVISFIFFFGYGLSSFSTGAISEMIVFFVSIVTSILCPINATVAGHVSYTEYGACCGNNQQRFRGQPVQTYQNFQMKPQQLPGMPTQQTLLQQQQQPQQQAINNALYQQGQQSPPYNPTYQMNPV